MSIAYPVNQLSIISVVAMEAYHVSPGSMWTTGNLLFRSDRCGQDLLVQIHNLAHAVARDGRKYLVYAPDHPKAHGLVSKPLDSHYCFELFPLRS
ncbi:MAG: hypothetical protein U5R49_18530 [Deltaproteobacteria bacterium]|nr:hypothetical protein [Deltaproteobacteria bacterium]